MERRIHSGRSVVMPETGAASCLTILRSLGRRGVHTIAISEEETAPGFTSRFCDEAIVVPSPGEDLIGYRDALLSLARREDVRTIVPMREEDAYVLSKYRSEFADYVATLWPSFDTLRTVHDRVRLVEAAEQAGVVVPETELLDEVDDWSRELIVKSRYAILADEYDESLSPDRLVDPPSTTYLEPGVEPDRERIVAEMGHVPIVQEYVPGTEYALWALYDRGERVATCQKRQLRAWKYAGGTSICRETVRIPELESVGRALLDHLDWHGLASVQFMRDANTGEFALMEVNPRTWVSLSCPVRAGVDFPYYYWRLAGGDSFSVDSEYEAGVATHLLRGEVSYLISVLRDDVPFVERPRFAVAAWNVVSSLYAQPNVDFFTIDDPCPFVRGLRNAFRRNRRAIRRSVDEPAAGDARGVSSRQRNNWPCRTPNTGSTMHESTDERANDDARGASMKRRAFLERTGAVAGVGLGLGALQDDGEQQLRRKFALQRVARFETDEPTDDYVGRGLLVTTKANVEGSPEGVGDCGFPDWSPEGFVKYQVLLFDVNQGVITESRAFVAEGSDPIPTGTPFIINSQVPCSGRYVGVEGEHVPSRLVE